LSSSLSSSSSSSSSFSLSTDALCGDASGFPDWYAAKTKREDDY